MSVSRTGRHAWGAVALSALLLAGCGAAEPAQEAAPRRDDRTAVTTAGPAPTDQSVATADADQDEATSEGPPAADDRTATAAPTDVDGDGPGEAADGLDVSSFDRAVFSSASGLTRCAISADQARCDLPSGFSQAAVPDTGGCWSEDNPEARPSLLRVGRFASWGCPDGPPLQAAVGAPGTEWVDTAPWDPEPIDGVETAVLPFGSTIRHQGVSCTVEPDAMVCRSRSGASFSLNTAGARFETEGEPVELSQDGFGEARFGQPPAEVLPALTRLLGPPEESGYGPGCFLAGEGHQSWSAQWGAFGVSGSGFDRDEITVTSWWLGRGTTSVPVVFPEGLTQRSTLEEVLGSDPSAERLPRAFGQPGATALAHGLQFEFDEPGSLLAVRLNPEYCE